MKILKKHYEKFIFILMLLLFLVLFGFEFASAANPVEDTFRVPIPVSDYPKSDNAVKFEEERYDMEKTFKNMVKPLVKPAIESKNTKTPATDKTGAKDKKEPAVKEAENLGIDFLAPPILAKCPNGEHFIPITDFPLKEAELKQKKCSFCSSPLEHIPPEQLAAANPEISTKDSDEDGIPDADEIKNGMNPNDKNDARQDFDNDGFTNLEEYRAKTDIKDPTSRDSYAKKLYVKEIKESPIGLKIVRIQNDRDQKNTDKWVVQFDSVTRVKRGKNIRESRNVKRGRVGREIKKCGYSMDDYVIEKIEPKFDDKKGQSENISIVTLKRKSDGLLFVARNGEEFFDPRKEVTYEVVDLPLEKRKEIKVTVNQEFSIGNDSTGVDKFVTISATIRPKAANPEDRMTARVKQTKKVKDKVRTSVENIKTRRTDIMTNDSPAVNSGESIPRF